MRSIEQKLSGWGNYPVERCHVTSPHTLAALEEVVVRGEQENYIPRGLGRAYGDSALNQNRGVIDQLSRSRFLSFDEGRGELECEAGVSFADIMEWLLPRGWFAPTVPGSKYVTIGGAIAADVHGKNHHVDGSFGNFVLGLKLMVASGDVIDCSPTHNSEMFWATVGGMGLTGVIVSARLQLKKAASAYCSVDFRRTRDLDQTFEFISETEADYRYSVAWIDCLNAGRGLGRSVLMLGNDAPVDDLPEPLRTRPLALPCRWIKTVPPYSTGLLLNRFSAKALNTIYYARHSDRRRLVSYDDFFFPLDSVLHWNRIYGRRGFVQYQALFPIATSRRGLIECLEKVVAAQSASFLAVLKSSGPASDGVLSYLFPGHTLALELPNTGQQLARLTSELDDILLKHGGRLYLAKDAMTTRSAFAAMYPRLGEFREIKSRIDPSNRFVSSQARRLGIVEGA